jgi:hypothetical protein
MSQGIAAIKNVTVSHKFGSPQVGFPFFDDGVTPDPSYEVRVLEAGQFTHTLTGMSSFPPHCIILRSFSWSCFQQPRNGILMLWSNLINDFICSWCDDSLTSNQIHLRIMPTSPIPNCLEFKLYNLVNGKPEMCSAIQGEFAAHFEFITYGN